jgi:sarcosine oxidase subunit beta
MEGQRLNAPEARFDAIVVGGGVYGASILYHLASAGVAAALFERNTLASGPTGRSSANVRLHYSTPELAEIARWSYAIMDRFAELTGGDNAFMRVGVLYGVPPHEVSAWEASVERHRAAGSEIETRTGRELADLVPGFRLDGIAMGVWEPRTGYADPVGTTTGFVDKARQLGARVHVHSAVRRLLTEDGTVRGVELVDGRRFEARRVLVAAGPWSRGLIAECGVDLPLVPERHAITLVAAPDGSRRVVPSVWSDRPNRYYARPEGDELVLLGGRTSRTAPVADADRFDESVPLAESAEHVERAGKRIPAIAGLGIRPGYAGIYDTTPDAFPIADAVPGVEGLTVVAGTSGHGFKLAPGLGAAVARLALGDRDPVLRPFSIDRSFEPTGELSA